MLLCLRDVAFHHWGRKVVPPDILPEVWLHYCSLWSLDVKVIMFCPRKKFSEGCISV